MALDYSRFDEALALVESGNETVEANCSCCQGHSMPGRNPGEPGYCSECFGKAYVLRPLHELWSYEKAIDYWQARALVAEARLSQAQGEK